MPARPPRTAEDLAAWEGQALAVAFDAPVLRLKVEEFQEPMSQCEVLAEIVHRQHLSTRTRRLRPVGVLERLPEQPDRIVDVRLAVGILRARSISPDDVLALVHVHHLLTQHAMAAGTGEHLVEETLALYRIGLDRPLLQALEKAGLRVGFALSWVKRLPLPDLGLALRAGCSVMEIQRFLSQGRLPYREGLGLLAGLRPTAEGF